MYIAGWWRVDVLKCRDGSSLCLSSCLVLYHTTDSAAASEESGLFSTAQLGISRRRGLTTPRSDQGQGVGGGAARKEAEETLRWTPSGMLCLDSSVVY